MSGPMLWGGRFDSGPDPGLLELSVSTDVDLELLPFDLQATRAHARTLVSAGLLERGALEALDRSCNALLAAWENGDLEVAPEDEDVHSVVERWLTDDLGDIGRSIHAGRSRNDLVVTDLRLWCRAAADQLISETEALVDALCDVAEEHLETVMPGYTHLQRAQPVTLAFHLAAHATALRRDVGRLRSAGDSANVSPLGAGALATTSLTLDPSIAAAEMGFGSTFSNAMDAVSDRDFAADLIYACTSISVHLSRFAEEVVLWTSGEFGFAKLSDEWSTGSSMMPQKRNPDLAELSRGRAASAIGDLVGFMTLLKGLPLAYMRDLQEDKAILFRSVATVRRIIVAMRYLVGGMTFDKARMEAAAKASGSWATDVAEELVKLGVPFRSAHSAAGDLVARLEEESLALHDASDEMLRAAHPALTRAVVEGLSDPLVLVARRDRPGGPAPGRVRAQLAELRSG